MAPNLWIVVLVAESRAMEFMGVFDSEPLAIAACTAPAHMVGPVVLNERLPDGPLEWPSAFYPLEAPAEA